MNAVDIRPMRPEDWPEVEAIYREGLATGNASFEAEPPTWDAFDAGKLGVGRLVAVDADGGVTGWVAASAVSTRAVYRGVVAGQWRDTDPGRTSPPRRSAVTREPRPGFRVDGVLG